MLNPVNCANIAPEKFSCLMKFTSTICTTLIFVILLGINQPALARYSTPKPKFQPGYRFQFKTIPKHAWNDIKYTFWNWNGVALTIGLGASSAFYPVDDAVSQKFASHPLFGKQADDVIGNVISPYTLAGASFITFLISNTTQNSKLTLAMESASEANFFAMSLVGIGKIAFLRQRPNGGKFSYPSAHSAAAFATATVLTEFYGIPAAIPSYAIASLVSLSRLDGHEHHLTDVLAGAVLGTAVGIGTSLAHKHEYGDFVLIPQVSSNEAGLTLYKSF